MRVGGAAFLGDGDTGRRCAVPLSGGYLFPHTGQAFSSDRRGGQPPALRCGELQADGRADRAVGGLSEGVPRQQAHCD